jgi:ABC-type phosphate transport system substrate-binding protein
VRGLLIQSALLLVCLTAPAAADIAVIVHPDVTVDDLSFADLRKIMLGDRQFWASGQKITLIVAEPVDTGRSVLLERVYNKSEQQFRQFWIARVFRGEATEGPKVVISSEGVMEMVSVLAGSIAFVDFDDVPSGVKALKIDGKLPGEAEYALGSDGE